jgi:hypothetical protein
MKNTKDILIESIEDNPVQVQETFDELMKQKISEILEQKKIEVASSFFLEPRVNEDVDDLVEDEDDLNESVRILAKAIGRAAAHHGLGIAGMGALGMANHIMSNPLGASVAGVAAAGLSAIAAADVVHHYKAMKQANKYGLKEDINEELEPLDELSKGTLQSYIDKNKAKTPMTGSSFRENNNKVMGKIRAEDRLKWLKSKAKPGAKLNNMSGKHNPDSMVNGNKAVMLGKARNAYKLKESLTEELKKHKFTVKAIHHDNSETEHEINTTAYAHNQEIYPQYVTAQLKRQGVNTKSIKQLKFPSRLTKETEI